MHADEVDIDAALVHELVAAQFPEWADLPLIPVASAGTDNAMFRLGSEMAVRLPRYGGAVSQVEKEQQWLPRLAPHLPLAVPVPLAQGSPGEGYPWSWSIYGWLDGKPATDAPMTDPAQAAGALADFVGALQGIDPEGGPAPGAHNSSRGLPLSLRDEGTRAAISSLAGSLNAKAATAAWEADSGAPRWRGPGVWLHGDLQPANLLVVAGRPSAVIDFGCLAVGDPACDVMAAWSILTAETRPLFRDALMVDDATWARARGLALSVSLVCLPYYRDTNPGLCAIARRTISEVLADHGATGPQRQ
jgi:aminoglycoside phosphotransferase (APT) family kinase protein